MQDTKTPVKQGSEADSQPPPKRTRRKAADIVAEICGAGEAPTATINNNPDLFWRVVDEYPRREALTFYLWRIHPKIDRKRRGLDTNIAIWPVDKPGSVDQDRVVAEFGEGRYKARLNDSNRRGNPTIAVAVFEIDDPDHPAVIETGDLINDPKNGSFIQWCRQYQPWQLWWETHVQEQQKAAASGANGAGGEASAVREVIELARDVLDRNSGKDPIELAIQAQHAFGSKSDNLGDIIKLAKLLSDRPAAASPDPVFSMLMPAFLEMLKANSKPQRSGLGEVKELVELFGLLRESGGDRGGGGESGWASFFQSMPSLLGSISKMFGDIVQLKALQAGAGVAAPSPGVPFVPPQSGASGLTPTATPAAAIAGGNGDTPVDLQQLIGIGQRAVAAFQRGTPGDEFASAIHTLDPDVYDLVSSMSTEQIMGTLQAQPAVWAQLQPVEAGVRQFIEDFVSWGEAEEEDEDEDEEAETGVQAAGGAA